MLKFSPVLLCVLMTACASQYQLPEAADSASLTIHHSMATYPSTTTVNVFDNQDCLYNEQAGELAKIGNDTYLNTKKTTVKIAAGKPVFLASYLWRESGNEQYGFFHFNCSKLISFTPQKNAHYVLKNKAVKNVQCEITLVDKSSQLPVLDVKKYKTVAACQKTGKFDF